MEKHGGHLFTDMRVSNSCFLGITVQYFFARSASWYYEVLLFKVLDAGHLKEFNEPYSLLRCRNSLLYQLVAQTGASEAQKLFDIARKKYMERHPAKAIHASNKPEEEMGALEVVEQDDDDDEGVEVKQEESNGDSNGKDDLNTASEGGGREEGGAVAEEEKGDVPDDEKAHLLVGFKPEGEDGVAKDGNA